MPTGARNKALFIAMLIGAAIVGEPTGGAWSTATNLWWTAGLLAFGFGNVLISVPGTRWVRAIAVAATVGALLWPSTMMLVVLLAWLVWPPAFTAGWALARDARAESQEDRDDEASAHRSRVTVAAIIAAAAIASIAYRLLFAHHLHQTAALFIGLPALTAIAVVFAVSPRSATGVACKAVTVGLLASAVLLQEGILCIFMSAPLFYIVAIVVAGAMEMARRHDNATTYSVIVILAVVPLSLEGVTGFTTINRNESVTESKMVDASAEQVAQALLLPPRFDRTLPLYLRAGFPTAVSTQIERNRDGIQWVIRMRGGEMFLNGMEPRTGELVLALDEARSGLARWRVVSDSSHMTHFLTWRNVVVQWEAVNAGTTRVTWTLRYQRGLDPAWYFGPWERYAVRLAAGYLIDSVATP